MLDRNRIKAKGRQAVIIAVITTIICGLLAALAVALFVIDKLNKNNLFIKSVLVDNNYILNMNANYSNEGADDGVDEAMDPVAYALNQLFKAVGELDEFKVPMKYLRIREDGAVSVDISGSMEEEYLDDMNEWGYVVFVYYSENDDSPIILGEQLTSDSVYSAGELPGADGVYIDVRDEEGVPDGYTLKQFRQEYSLDTVIQMLNDFFAAARDTYSANGVGPAADRLVEDYFKKTLFYRYDLAFESTEKKKNALLDVPYITQEGMLPNGCESVSAVMLLRYLGYDITPEEFVDDYLECEPVSIRWGCRYGPNPKLKYAGDPRSEDQGYGCFAPVIVRALNKFLAEEDCHAKNVSGMSLEQLKKEFIDHGIPVAVWVTVGMEEIDKIVLWQSTDGEESFMYPANEHCMVFCGYGSGAYIFADPYGSNGIVSYPIDESVLAYNSLNMQAVVVLPDGNIGGR